MSRGPSVGFRFVAIMCLGLVLGGCSYLFVSGPPLRPDRSRAFDCTTSNGWPVFDVIYGTVNTAANISLANKDDSKTNTYVAGAVGSVILWGSSALVGFGRTSRCRKAKRLDGEALPYEPTPYESPALGRARSGSSIAPQTRECPGGMQQVDSVHCCWPGQRFIVEGAQCSGKPTCPPGMVASGASCLAQVAECPSGMQQVDSVHCCWPGQRFIVEGAQCSGKPTCPPGMVASGASCLAPPPDHK
jgi:hypothetical protein